MKHSVKNRFIIGAMIGLVAGLAVFFVVPLMGAVLALKFGLGLVLFYVLLGGFIAFVGMFERHPIFNFKMPWWLRGVAIGLVFHLMLILLSYDQITLMVQQMDFLGMRSPWWALIDGVLLGLIMAFTETKLAGEGQLPLK